MRIKTECQAYPGLKDCLGVGGGVPCELAVGVKVGHSQVASEPSRVRTNVDDSRRSAKSSIKAFTRNYITDK